MPKVSIIIPCYRAEKYLSKCIESALAQTLYDIEIIALSEGHDDDTLDILLEYQRTDKRIKVLDVPEEGQAFKMNRGVKVAQGEFVCELDSDDYIEPEFCETLYTQCKLRHLDYIQCGYVGFSNEYIRKVPVAPKEACGFVIAPQSLSIYNAPIIFGRVVSVWAGMYRRSMILDNNLWWRDKINFEDTCIAFGLRACAKRAMLWYECLYHHREDNPNSGTATIKEVRSIFKQFDRVFELSREHGVEHLNGYLSVWMYYTFAWAYKRIKDEQEAREFIRTWAEYNAFYPAAVVMFNTEEDAQSYLNISRAIAPPSRK